MEKNNIVENIIISPDLLKLYSPIPLNVEEEKLYPFLLSAQNKIREIIGNALVENLLLEIKAGQVSKPNQALLIKIAPALSAYAIYYALPSLAYQVTQKGVNKENSENSDSVELKELNYLRLDIQNQADRAADALKNYLCECSDLYPLFDSSKCSCNCGNDEDDKLTPQIYFPGVDSSCGCGCSSSSSDPSEVEFTLEDKLKLDHIEAFAQKNVQSDWEEENEGSDSYIKNKPDFATKEYVDEAIEDIKISSGNLVVVEKVEDIVGVATFEIRDDLDLKGKTIRLAVGSSLFFNGGSLNNGKVWFTKNHIYGDPKINCNFTGNLRNTEVKLSWFGCDDTKLTLEAANYNCNVLEKLFLVCANTTIIIDGIYPLGRTVNLNNINGISLQGIDNTQAVYANRTYQATSGFRWVGGMNNESMFSLSDGEVELYGISLIGIKDLYTGRNLRNLDENVYGPFVDRDSYGQSYSQYAYGPVNTNGIFLSGSGTIKIMEKCSIVGFTNGIKSVGGYMERVEDCFFSACRFGMNLIYTSDFFLNNCKFNTCLNDYDFRQMSIQNDAAEAREIGAGLRLCGCAMVQIEACRFEFNFIHLILDEASYCTTVNGCVFDKGTYSHILSYNGDVANNLSTVPSDREIFHPSICVNFNGNYFLRGSRIDWNAGDASYNSTPGKGIFFLREDPGNTEDWDDQLSRGTRLVFTGNMITDFEEIDPSMLGKVTYQDSIFFLSNNRGATNCEITLSGNDFSGSKSTYLFEETPLSSGEVYYISSGSNNISRDLMIDKYGYVQKKDYTI